MCLAVSTDDQAIELVRAAVANLRINDDPYGYHASAVEYEILKAGLDEAELVEFGLCPADPAEREVLVISAEDG